MPGSVPSDTGEMPNVQTATNVPSDSETGPTLDEVD
jgi:hypothetical protein